MSKAFENVLKLNNTDYIDTRWYGTVHDWTTDSTTAFQAAVDAAKNGNVRRIGVAPGVVVTNIDLTGLYVRGIEIFGITRASQTDGLPLNPGNNKASTILVKGATSRGFDLTGTRGLRFKNLSLKGLDTDPPLCLVYASRTPGSGLTESFDMQWQDCEFLGVTTKAHVYNYAGEGWHFLNCRFVSVGSYAFYGTTLNTLGVTSTFRPAIPTTGAGSARPLTVTRFTYCLWDVQMDNGAAIWFEGRIIQGGGSDTTIQSITIDGGYIVCRSVSGGSGAIATAACVRLTEVTGQVHIRNFVDESNATSLPNAYLTFLRQEGVVGGPNGDQQLRTLHIESCTFFGPQYVIDAEAVQGFYAASNYSWGSPTWKFGRLVDAYHFNFFNNENFEVTGFSQNVWVYPFDATATAKVTLSGQGINLATAPLANAAPTGALNPFRRGAIAFDRRFMAPYLSVGSQTAVDSFGWQQLMIQRNLSAIPTTGNWLIGTIIWKTFPTLGVGNFVGWVCINTGTAGTLNSGATTGSISNGSTTLTVNSATGLEIGSFILIAGVTGRKEVTAVNGTTITINSAADATVSGAAVSYSAPSFAEFGQVNGGSASATSIADVGNAINTTNKVAGKTVWDTTNNRLMRASGSAAADPWWVVDGSTSVTPS